MSEHSTPFGKLGELDVPPMPTSVRASYERGRRRWAFPRALLVMVPVVPAILLGVAPGLLMGLAGILVVVAAVAGWRSPSGLLGAISGALLGASPLVMGGLVGDACTCAGGLCFSTCALACAGTSAALGAGAGFTFGRLEYGRGDFAVAAVICAAVGLVVCPMVGVGSVLGALLGMAVAAPPAALWAVRHQRLLA